MKRKFDLTTTGGMKLARSFLGRNPIEKMAFDGIVSIVKKLFSPEVAVDSQYKAQTDMLTKVMASAKDGDELEIEIDDGVMNGIAAKLPEYGEVSLGARANGKCKFTLRRKC